MPSRSVNHIGSARDDARRNGRGKSETPEREYPQSCCPSIDRSSRPKRRGSVRSPPSPATARDHKRFSLSSEIGFSYKPVIMRPTMRSRRKPLRSGCGCAGYPRADVRVRSAARVRRRERRPLGPCSSFRQRSVAVDFFPPTRRSARVARVACCIRETSSTPSSSSPRWGKAEWVRSTSHATLD